ncbi:Centrosomal protein of 19 kDa [Chytriomyces hyalinus]|nr:Centrosomal protein of 19 kDa [Chytriomyces hyalinus]
MRQRYRDTDWKYETELFNEPAKYEPTCIVSSIGAKFKPATLYVFFKDMEQGKYKRRKIPVRDLSKSVQIESIAHALIKRHDILNVVPFKNLLSVLEKIQSQLGSQTSEIISKPNNTTTTNTTKDLPPLPKALPPPPYAPVMHESSRIDGSLNLNKLGDDALSKVKSDMNFEFEKNRIKPGDAAFEYDVQKSFGPPVENNDWDQESESIQSEPQSQSRAEKVKPPQTLGDLETDASSSAKDEISNMDDEISALLDDDFMPKKSPKMSVYSVERDEESGKASSTAFWWMKNDAEDAGQGPKTEPFKPEPSWKVESASTTIADAVKVKPLMAETTPIETSLAAKPILLSSGMSATLKALEQTRSLLGGSALDTHSTDSTSSKLAPLSPPKSSTKLSDLPPISFERFDKPRELLPHSEISSAVAKEAKKDVVLDIDDLDIDAGFAKYDVEEDEADDDANDLLNAFLPHKKVEPLLPAAMPVDSSKPSHTALSSIVIDAMADAKLSKPSIINTSVPTVVDTFYTPIDEDFGDILNQSADESEEDLSFLKKPSPQINHTSAVSESQPALKKANSESRMESPKFESVYESPKVSMVSATAAAPAISVPGEPSAPSDTIKKEHASKPNDSAKPVSVLGPLPSLGPLPTLARLNPVPSNAADSQPAAPKKDFDDEDDISEDFDFDGSVSDLLGIDKDSDSVKGKSDDEKSASLISHVNVASLRDKIPGIVGATSAMNLMKPLVDDASDAKSKSMAVDYEDDFGAGDTDSDSGGISNLADQSPAFKIKTRDVQFDGSDDDELDNLFRDDLVDLEVDDHRDEDDAF